MKNNMHIAGRRSAALLLAVALFIPTALQAAEETRTTAYVYDAQGQLVREVVEPTDAALCVASVYTYDAHGQRSSVQQRNCNGSAIPGVGSEAAAPAAGSLAAFTLGAVTQQYSHPGVAGATARQVTTANALFMQSMEVMDPRFGTPSSVTDANGRVTRWRYDGLGRKTLEQRPDGNGTRWIYQRCGGGVACAGVWNAVVDRVTPAYVVTSYPVRGADVATDAGIQDGPHTKVYYDNLERELRIERQGWDGDGVARLIYEDTAYNTRGKLHRKSAPYEAGGTPAWAKYIFDVMGRVEFQSEPHPGAFPAGYTTWSYQGLKVQRTVQAVSTATTHSTQTAQTTTETRNAAGQLVAVTDTEGRTQTRSYTAWGDLAATVDPLGNTVRMEYDRLGRKTRLIDPDLGTWTYQHDALGRLVRQTDAKGQVTTLSYDLLGRLQRRLEADHDSRWFYDTQYADGSACAHARGSLCEAATYTGTGTLDLGRRLVYDSLGRVSRTTTRAAALPAGTTGEYHADVSYNSRGQVATQTYPGPAGARLSLTLGYTALGYLQTVSNSASGLAYWRGTRYDAQGHPLTQTYGNGVVTTRSHDPVGRLLSSAAGSGNAVQNDSYAYDLQGKLRSRSETRADAILTWQYDYDNLNRLKTEARSGGGVSGTQTIAWSYDAIGNITSRSDVGTYAYPAAGGVRPHAVSSISGTVNGVANPGYSYDANGNIEASAGRSVTWKSFNLPATLARGAHTLSWGYDSEHERVREDLRINGTLTRTTVYVNPAAGAGLYYEEELSAGVLKRRHYISGGHGTVAVLTRTGTSDEVRYWHQDHLGSTAVVTSESGAVVERLEYEPFGKRRGADNRTDAAGTLTASSTDRGFTGHEMLDEVGLVHMNGRIYDPAIGRFLSADPGVPDPENLQSYNRYSYTRNNPLGMTDPSGFNETYCDCSYSYDGYGSSYNYGYSYSTSYYDAPSIFSGAGSGWGSTGGTGYYGLGTGMYMMPKDLGSGTSSYFAPVRPLSDLGSDTGHEEGGRESIWERVFRWSDPQAQEIRKNMIYPTRNAMVQTSGIGLASLAAVTWGTMTGNDALVQAGFDGARESGVSAGGGLSMAMSLALGGRQAAKGAGDGLGFTRSQLQHAFKHAKDFGVTGNANNKTMSEFSSVLQSHVDAAGTRAIQGTYRGNPVTHHLDPSTGLNVIRDSSGNFLSGWKLSPQQLQHVLTTGKLGGG